MSNLILVENLTSKVGEKLPMSVDKKDAPKKKFLEIICPYCSSVNFVKRGTRQKKNEVVQLYLCSDCRKTFTPGKTKGKHYPISVILDAISLYYLGYSLEEVVERMKKIINANKTDIDTKMLGTGTLLEWINQYEPLCAFARMRPFALKLFSPEKTISSATLAHRQLYRFRHHRSKTCLLYTSPSPRDRTRSRMPSSA